jgi:hypothetical protein
MEVPSTLKALWSQRKRWARGQGEVLHRHLRTVGRCRHQLLVALYLNYRYDRRDVRSLLVGAIYPLAYWMISAAAALHSEVSSVLRGPRGRRVVWDVPLRSQGPERGRRLIARVREVHGRVSVRGGAVPSGRAWFFWWCGVSLGACRWALGFRSAARPAMHAAGSIGRARRRARSAPSAPPSPARSELASCV